MFAALRSTQDRAPALDAPLCVATTAFYAVALVAPWHAGVAALGFLIAVATRRWRVPIAASPAATAFVGVSVLLAVTAFLPLLLHPIGDHGVKLLAQFLLLPAIAGLCWFVPRSPGLTVSLWAGVTTGAVLAGAAALTQVVVFDLPRAVGTEGNAIVFGDLALLMGVLSIALARPAMTWWSTARAHDVGLATTAAAIGGTVASLLSGSRGGWLAIAPAAVILLRYRPRSTSGHASGAWAAVGRNHVARAALAATALFAVTAVAGGMPFDRLDAGVDDITGYVAGEAAAPGATPVDPAGTTIGARFEAWRAAADAVADHPVLGIGWGNLQSHFERQVVTEGRHHRIAEFTHAHQQVLGAWASSGIVGAAAFVAVVAVPGRHFRRAARSADDERRAIGAAGLVVVASFAVFGLTEAIFENLVPVVFYAVTIGLLSSQLRVGEQMESSSRVEAMSNP
jgi:O-antigen ligase